MAQLLEIDSGGGGGGGGIVGPATVIYLAPPPLGNDATGARGDASKPFATLDAAIAVMQSGDSLALAPNPVAYAAPSAPFPLSLLQGTITTWLNGSEQNVAIESLVGPCIDLSGGPRDLWRINGIRLSSPTGTDALTADGIAAPAGTYFPDSLVLSQMTITSGGLSCRYAGSVVLAQVTHVSDNESCKLFSCGFVINLQTRYFGQNFSYQIDDNNDDPLAPTSGGTSQLQPKRFDGACVFPSGTIALENQAGVVIAPGAFMPSLIANSLTRPLINPAWLSEIAVYGHLGGNVTINNITNGIAQYGFDFQGMTLGGNIDVQMVPGGFGTRVNLCGATVEGTGVFGEGITANLRDSDWQGGLLASVTTPGSNGNIIPPTFAMGPVQTAIPTQFNFPFRLNSDQYAVAVDFDLLANLPGAVSTRTTIGFDVTPTAAAANTFVRAIVSFYGN